MSFSGLEWTLADGLVTHFMFPDAPALHALIKGDHVKQPAFHFHLINYLIMYEIYLLQSGFLTDISSTAW